METQTQMFKCLLFLLIICLVAYPEWLLSVISVACTLDIEVINSRRKSFFVNVSSQKKNQKKGQIKNFKVIIILYYVFYHCESRILLLNLENAYLKKKKDARTYLVDFIFQVRSIHLL